MRFLGFLICLAGIVFYLPAWLQWANLILSGHANRQNLADVAPAIFQQAGPGAVLFWVGVLMIAAFRK